MIYASFYCRWIIGNVFSVFTVQTRDYSGFTACGVTAVTLDLSPSRAKTPTTSRRLSFGKEGSARDFASDR